MPTKHVVLQGEHLPGIAARYGFRDFGVIWNHSENSALKEKRNNPNTLCPGDRIYIPDIESKIYRAETGRKHRFELSGKQLMLRLILKDSDGTSLANTQCALVMGMDSHPLTTDENGKIEMMIPINADKAELVFEKADLPFDAKIPIKIGHLDSLNEPAGWKARLNNLGYDAGPLDSDEDPQALKSAIEEFQCDNGLKVTGICDGATLEKLKNAYGC
jgi:hypothetical protein